MPIANHATSVPVIVDDEKCIAHKGCKVCVEVCPLDVLASDLDDIAARCTDDDAGVRRVAMLELAEVTDEGAVPLLVKGLGDADPAVREAAAKALDEHSGE